LCSFYTYAQQATLKGRVTEDGEFPLPDVTIGIDKSEVAVLTDSLGYYTIQVPAGKKVQLQVHALGYYSKFFNVTLKDGEIVERNIFLDQNASVMTEIEVKAERVRAQVGAIGWDKKEDDFIRFVGPVGGVEGQIKGLVGNRNETSNQYNVRGGSFDENLVYVNDFEINRPFLVRSGQQEGLSFVNPDMVKRVSFSVGGFQAQYGDKMASVLDVSYNRPDKFSGTVAASLLGLQVYLGGASKNAKLSYGLGFRQKSNQYLLQSQPTKGQYNPSFTDLQALVNYRFSKKFEMELIGNYALNRFSFTPESLREAFGSATQAFSFKALYDGGELSKFDNTFGGISFHFKPNEKLKLKLLASMFNSFEQETYDINAMYMLSVVEMNLGSDNVGKELYSLGSGAMHRYARNYLSATVANAGLKGTYLSGRHSLNFGTNLQYVDVADRLMEWERRDSAGFSIPYDPYKVNMYKYYKADNALAYSKWDAYVQDNILLHESTEATLVLGLRGTYNFLNEEFIVSPRGNFSFHPVGNKQVLFKVAAGLYAQPPFYREMRAMDGTLNTALKAQKSLHFAGGFDYNFIALNNRPFKLTGELFYKDMWDLVPYDYENVRIRYAANNNGIGYAYGGELRLFGDLVKDAESWVSVGYLKTMERILDPNTNEYGSWQPRPTDGRVTFGVFFSDYLPQNQNFKVFLNMMYATGLPSPSNKQDFSRNGNFRIPDYRRVDIGFAALLLDASKKKAGYYSFFKGIKSVWASLEVFNLMAFSNTLSYEYIESLNSNYNFYVPNRLTPRLINFKLQAHF
jgi:hypothetical protein